MVNLLRGIILFYLFVFSSYTSAESFNRYVNLDDSRLFFQFEINCKSTSIEFCTNNDDIMIVTSIGFEQKEGMKFQKELEQTYKKGTTNFQFDYGQGIKSKISLTTKRIDSVEYRVVVVDVTKDEKPLASFKSNSNVYYSLFNQKCFSRHGDAGFQDEIIEIKYPKKLQTLLYELSEKNGWVAQIWKNDKELYGNEFFFANEDCNDRFCNINLDVGFGNEFFAASQFNKLDKRICAVRPGLEAGGPPLTVAGIPLNTFISLNTNNNSYTIKKIKNQILDVLFEKKTVIGNILISGRGKSFTFSVLGPSKTIGINYKDGYWYKANINVNIGINVADGELFETIQITVLDLIEIRAPEHLDVLPSALIDSGKYLTYLDEKNEKYPNMKQPSKDGILMNQWTLFLATKIIELVGGFIDGYQPISVCNNPKFCHAD